MEKWFAKNRQVSSRIFFAQKKKSDSFLHFFVLRLLNFWRMCPTFFYFDMNFWVSFVGWSVVKKTEFSNGLQNCSIFITFDLKSQNWPLPTVIFPLQRKSKSWRLVFLMKRSPWMVWLAIKTTPFELQPLRRLEMASKVGQSIVEPKRTVSSVFYEIAFIFNIFKYRKVAINSRGYYWLFT